MSQKTILPYLIFFLFISFAYLAWTEKQQHEPDFWVVYFADPKSQSLDFVIKNDDGDKDFHWSVSSGKNKPYLEENVMIKKGGSVTVPVNMDFSETKEITIRVNDGLTTRELSKVIMR